MPNLARLLEEGASFRRFFTSAPLCSPSRAVFLTGQYPHRNGIVDNGERAAQSHEILTFPKLLHDAGYRTGFFGKWHRGHTDDSARPGFDRWVSFVGRGVYFDPDLNIDGATVRAKGYMTDVLVNEAVSFIEAAQPGQPFMVFLAHKVSHPEVHPNRVRSFPPAPGDENLYRDDPLPRSPSWRESLRGKRALARRTDHGDPRSPRGGLPDEIVRDRLRRLSAVDRGLGRLRKSLIAKGVWDDTVFVLTSDQGFFYGEFGLAQERRLAYEPSIRIPPIVRYPAVVKAGSEVRTLASNVDVAPTLLELAGVGAPRLRRLGYQAVRTDRYKYIRYRELRGMDELYDLERDPHELTNLLPRRAPAALVIELRRRLDQRLLALSASRLRRAAPAAPRD